jgi:hypothetical protein
LKPSPSPDNLKGNILIARIMLFWLHILAPHPTAPMTKGSAMGACKL